MEENINIVEILKDKSTRTKLYSPLYGEVFLSRLVGNNGIRVLCKGIDGSLGTDEKSFLEKWEVYSWGRNLLISIQRNA